MCSLRRERDLEALVYELLERACLRFWSRAADVINNKWFRMPLPTEPTLTCVVDGVMENKRSEPKYRPANGIFFNAQRGPVWSPPREELSVSHFYWIRAEDASFPESPRRIHGPLPAPPGGAEHGRPSQPTAALKASVSATNRTHIQR